MAVTYIGFGPTTLTTSDADLYTVPASYKFRLESLTITNTTGGAITYTIGVDTTSAADCLFTAVSLAANTSVQWDGKVLLNAAQTLNGLASANTSINVTGYGVLIN